MTEGVDSGAMEKGTEHLQAAAREMLSAARAFLDAVEDIVEDPDRIRDLGSAIGSVAHQAARVGKSAMGSDSETAWYDRDDTDEAEETGDVDGEPLF